MLEVLRTLQNSNIRTEGDLLFIGSVGEEGNGDLRGGKYLFSSKEEHIDGFISVDSACVAQLLHGSTGSRRFRLSPMKDPEDTAGLHSAFPVPRTH